jgi:4-azaleucine resistance transporter AzlC
MDKSLNAEPSGRAFLRGLRVGIPICLGYFAVAIALGITARSAGMNAVQSGIMSATMLASAGEFAAVTMISTSAGIIEMITTTIIVNLRYLLMSSALSQKLSDKTPFWHRFLLAYCVTDEIFGVSIAEECTLNPVYTYGVTIISAIGWTSGTVLGVLIGNILPARLINETAKIISDDGEDQMSFEIADGKVVMKFDNNRVIINTFSGKFIDYNRILSKQGDINVRVKRNDLLRSTERASLLASVQNNNLIRFDIDSDLIVIKSLNEEGNIEEKVEIINDGASLNIGLNSKYLKDALSVIEDEEIIINFRDSISPCVIKPLKGDKYAYLILPIRMN